MKKQINLYKYDNNVYPRKLWITDTVEGLGETFMFTYTNDTSEENPTGYSTLVKDKNNNEFILCTSSVIEKKSGLYGVLVTITDRNNISADAIAHESVHVADYVCQEVGIYTQAFSEGNEAYAYLVGWAAGSISDAIIKIKQKSND